MVSRRSKASATRINLVGTLDTTLTNLPIGWTWTASSFSYSILIGQPDATINYVNLASGNAAAIVDNLNTMLEQLSIRGGIVRDRAMRLLAAAALVGHAVGRVGDDRVRGTASE